MNKQNTPQPHTFAERLRAGRFVMTVEVTPPLSCDPEDLLRKAVPLRGLADAVNITDGAGARAHMGALAAAAIINGAGIEPILQLACRDRNRIALQSELMGAAALGIRNLMLLGGDDPKAGDQPETKAVFDIDSKTLIETARRLRDDGTLPTGRKVAGKAAFLIGAADVPIDRRRDGSRRRYAPRFRPAPSSCKRSSAWMRRSCAATSPRWRRPASRNSSLFSSASPRCARRNRRAG
jgi:5,10-methylenetetrahydrofolate reductase